MQKIPKLKKQLNCLRIRRRRNLWARKNSLLEKKSNLSKQITFRFRFLLLIRIHKILLLKLKMMKMMKILEMQKGKSNRSS